ncbi:XRE family transcriptional regulator [Mesorhizobium tamadayense]|uniref:XRE family transcriptional regulator n=2 Tax=Mesorhizobium tamadayense TaxID=425306 RepID=A0A3P3EMV4_9HYPH|nr:XRE family transcriptional regulator [Mesorhizobium tamadayense]
MTRSEFNTQAFLKALDRKKSDRKLNWRQVAELSGVSASTLTLMAQGQKPDVENLARLFHWSGLSADTFVGAGQGHRLFTEPFSQFTMVICSDNYLAANGRSTVVDTITGICVRLRDKLHHG